MVAEFGRLSPWRDSTDLKDEQAREHAALRAEISGKRFLGGQVHLFAWGTRQIA